jgi:hypothetical protein
MFEKIVLRRSDQGPALTAGELAEALLFYQHVHIILDHGSLSNLVTQIGMPTLVSLVSRQNVSAIYCEESLGTRTETTTKGATYSFIAFSLVGNQKVGNLGSRKKRLEFVLGNLGYEKKHARRLIERFKLKVPIRKLTDNYFIDGGIIRSAEQDLFDRNFIHESMKLSLTDMVGFQNVPSDFQFNVYSDESRFQIHTNLDFNKLNKIVKQQGLKDGEMTPAHLIGNILNARADTILASYYGGEFYTSNLTSDIIRLKYSELIRRIGIEKNELAEFSQIVIDTGPSLREVINNKERTFDDFLRMLDKSQKFRDWAKGVNPDEKLVKEYWNEVSSKGWISKLPTKILRYILGTTIGAIEPLTGHAVSVADSFLLEKILGGWRPSHFIDRTLKPFIDKEDD